MENKQQTEKTRLVPNKNRSNDYRTIFIIKHKKFLILSFIFIVLFISFFFVIGLFFNFFYPFKYQNVFEHVKLSSEYDFESIKSLLPIINLKLNDKNLILKHKLVSNKDDQLTKQNNLFYSFLFDYLNKNYYLKYKLKKNSYFKLNQINSNYENEKIKFKIAKLEINNSEVECFNVSLINSNINKQRSNGDIETCFNLEQYSWFGGHESYGQPYWPINTQSFDYVPYVTGFADDWSAALERYWLSSNGVAIYVDDDIPLFVKHDQNKNEICLKSSTQSHPYVYTPVYPINKLEYKLCKASDIKTVHMFMINNYLGLPQSRPDLLMMKLPIFTTWNYFFRNINQTIVLDYANQIKQNNYSVSQLEIDDKWESNYGNLDFDRSKFPIPEEMVSKLHANQIRVTLWVHPFCNIDSYNFVNGTKSGYWVKDSSGQHPGFTKWWNGQDTVILDTTNPDAILYFNKQLNSIRSIYKIDSFKFDAGETSWIPYNYKLYNNRSKPDDYSINYAKLANDQNNFVEIRIAHRTQNLGLFYRILDRASDWTIHDGLKSVITETLHFGLLGYPFVLPDIIGGNDDPNPKNKELFIRWTQLTAFLPAMQFGVPPWYFDQETNLICKKYVDLHVNLVFPYISQLDLDGQPIIRPIWWLEPYNQNAYNISDQFLVGDLILVAPILEQNSTTRQVYFPKGSWYDIENKRFIKGPISLKIIANIDQIPYYLSESQLSIVDNYFKIF